tara:strand:- start:3718 stop:5334 length:1617 start_codon:yes stop_codon:yes gene_type:complete
MAIRTPKSSQTYQVQVDAPSESPFQSLDDAPSIAAAGGSDSLASSIFNSLGDIAGKNADVIRKADEKNKQLEEDYLQGNITQSLISLGERYKSQSELNDPLIVGTKEDANLTAYTDNAEALLKTINKEKYPTLYLTSERNIKHTLELSKTQQYFAARKKIISINQAGHIETYNDFVFNLNESAALEYLNQEVVKDSFNQSAAGRLKLIDLKKDLKPKIENRRFVVDAETNPERTLERINLQLEGKVTSYMVPDTLLKTMRTQIKGVQKIQQKNAYTNMYLSEEYQNKLPVDKINYVRNQIQNENIDASTGIAEIRRLENGRAKMNADEIIKLRGTFGKIENLKLLEKDDEIDDLLRDIYTDENYSEEFINSLSRYVVNTRRTPINRTDDIFFKNTLDSNLTRIQEASIGDQMIVDETFLVNIYNRFIKKETDPIVDELETEDRTALIDQLNQLASAEYATQLKSFLINSEEMPTEQEISTESFRILNDLRTKYNFESLGNLLEEYALINEGIKDNSQFTRAGQDNNNKVINYNEILGK